VGVQRLSNSGRSGFSYKSLIAGITPIPSVPAIGTATVATFSSVNVAFTAPGAYAGATYTATSSPDGITASSATSPILVTGLSELTEYTFTVTATNATGTSGASAASSPVTTPTSDTGVMFPIAMANVGSAGAANIQFTSIPSTYKHLQIRGTVRADRAGSTDSVGITFNGVTTGGAYDYHILYGDGSTVTGGDGVNQNFTYPTITTAGTDLANTFSAMVVDILDYTNTNKNKTVKSLAGYDLNGSGFSWFSSGLSRNTSAISSIRIAPGSSGWAQYTQIALYGIKG